MTPRIAVVLMNLGGPDRKESIAPFLRNFFMDPAIIGAPYPVRYILSRYIAWKRSRREAGSSYQKLGYKSPLLDHSRDQANALQTYLNARDDGRTYNVHVVMRYWHPMTKEVLKNVLDQNPDQIILIPLYPQFSTTTTGSSYKSWMDEMKRMESTIPVTLLCCYPDETGWIAASADRVRCAYQELLDQGQGASKPPRILFSAHGLPEKIIRAGDPYQAQTITTAKAIVNAMGIEHVDYTVCYQSRVGPLKWIGPSIEEELKRAAADGVPVVVYPHAFVSEHVETLVELDDEYAHVADELGVPGYKRASTVLTHPDFISALSRMTVGAIGKSGVISSSGACRCDGHRACPMNLKNEGKKQ